MRSTLLIRVRYISHYHFLLAHLSIGLAIAPASAEAQQSAQKPANALGVGAPTYDASARGVVIPFAFGGTSCNNAERKPLVELDIEDSTRTLIAIPVLLAGDSAAAAQSSKLDGIPLKCGAYTAFWADSSGSLRRTPEASYWFRVLVDGVPIMARKAMIKY
jgi:hypothetical protein